MKAFKFAALFLGAASQRGWAVGRGGGGAVVWVSVGVAR